MLQWVDLHTPHDSFGSCDSYGSYPWEPPADPEDCTVWQEWKGSIYHPRTLIDDLKVYDWSQARYLIEEGAYLRDERRMISIRSNYFRYKKLSKITKKLNLK